VLNPAWVDQLAESFWTLAGGPPTGFPRDLEQPALFALPLATIRLPRLRPRSVDAWLLEHDAAALIDEQDQRLHACLLALGGHGLIFLDGADALDEQRFSLAHELAHFMLDYLRPREAALSALGPDILDVLDGRRLPTRHEQVHAALARVHLGLYVNLFAYGDPTVMGQERAADKLAVELLAPAEPALQLACVAASLGGAAPDRIARLRHELVTTFGLPTPIAGGYARRLLRHVGADETTSDWLGLTRLARQRRTSG
jgi:hypothetical protein